MSDSWTVACLAPLSTTISCSFIKFMSIESLMLSNNLILCHSFLLLPSIFPSTRVFSNKSSALHLAKILELQLYLLLATIFPNSTWFSDVISSVHSLTLESCPTLCDPMDSSTPDFPVHHQLPELTQTLIYRVSDAIQPSHPLLSFSPSAFNLSQHQGLFQWVSSSHQVAKGLVLQL